MALIFLLSLLLYLITGTGYEICNTIKPTTIMQYSGFLLFGLMLHHSRKALSRLNDGLHDILILLGFFVMMATSFEMLWAFFLWFSKYTILQGAISIDSITYIPLNKAMYGDFSLNVSAKKNTLLFFIGMYWTYYFHTIRWEKDDCKKERKQ